jgi:hypothetical protein
VVTEDRPTLESTHASTTLSKTETRLLTEAAGREDGLLVLPTTMKAATAQRLLGKLTKEGLITSCEQDGAVEHHLTPAGYRAVGLKAPRRPRAPPERPVRSQRIFPGPSGRSSSTCSGEGRGRVSRN